MTSRPAILAESWDRGVRGKGVSRGDGPDAFVPMPDALRLNPLESPPPPFARGRCHRVMNLSRADGNGWNELVTPLTADLLN